MVGIIIIGMMCTGIINKEFGAWKEFGRKKR